MKHRIATICLIVAMFSLAFATFSMGVREGIRRAMEESKVYAEGSSVFIDLDGQVYEHYID
jgi:hypothetical protein